MEIYRVFYSDILHQRGSHNGPFLIKRGVVAHLVEHLVRNQKVVGSSPIYSTKDTDGVLFCL